MAAQRNQEESTGGPCVIDLVSRSGDISVTPQSTPQSTEVSGPISLITPERGSSFDLTGQGGVRGINSLIEVHDLMDTKYDSLAGQKRAADSFCDDKEGCGTASLEPLSKRKRITPASLCLNFKQKWEENQEENDIEYVDLVQNGTSSSHPPMRVGPSSFTAEHILHPYESSRGMGGPEEDTGVQAAVEAVMETMTNADGERDVPQRTLRASLMKHQRMSLAWMCEREENTQVSGGILADDQGLGKTISTIALMVTNTPDAEWGLGGACASGYGLLDGKLDNDNSEPPIRGGTLVVCPATVLRQWESELKQKVHPDAGLSVRVHHGPGRSKIGKLLGNYSVVLTTYGTLLNEFVDDDVEDNQCRRPHSKTNDLLSDYINERLKEESGKTKKNKSKRKVAGPLFEVEWLRIVLDEAQIIKNANTRISRAVWKLRAEKRWCLSGTPVQNSIKDLFSFFRFLRYEPYCNIEEFNTYVKDKIARDPVNGFECLRAILKGILLRRTKTTQINGEPIVSLPERNLSLSVETMSPQEQEYYTDLQANVRKQVKVLANSGEQQYLGMLLLLLKLRQACCHPWLLDKSSAFIRSQGSATKQQKSTVGKLSAERREELKDAVNNVSEPCPLCLDLPENPVITPCKHIFCFQCVSSKVGTTGEADYCPVCGAPVKSSDLLPPAAFEEGTASERRKKWFEDVQERFELSTKMRKLMKILEEVRSLNDVGPSSSARNQKSASDRALAGVFKKIPNPRISSDIQGACAHKVLIFSQWTSMLDLIEIPLRKQGFQFRRLDGSMSLPKREAAIQEFKEKPEVQVMLMSLKSAALGLNLTCANHVILFDLWWNPTVEEQAIDRAHRIGQTRNVKVTRLMVKDSVEEKIIELQKSKLEIIQNTLSENGGGQAGSRAQLTQKDLEFLFGI